MAATPRVMAANGTGIIVLDAWKEVDPAYTAGSNATPWAARCLYWLLPSANRVRPISTQSLALPNAFTAASSQLPTVSPWSLQLQELNRIEAGTIVEVASNIIRAPTLSQLAAFVTSDFQGIQARLNSQDPGSMLIGAFSTGINAAAFVVQTQ